MTDWAAKKMIKVGDRVYVSALNHEGGRVLEIRHRENKTPMVKVKWFDAHDGYLTGWFDVSGVSL